jgi:formylglycine-generating enzyme required for sulfatase activity
MSDDRLRELERTHANSPSDAAALIRLQDERVRIGLGWRGEEMPSCREHGFFPKNEVKNLRRLDRNVYVARLTNAPDLYLELVYVPGGSRECDRCHKGTYPITTALYVNGDPNTCANCDSTGRVTTAPFYIGRYPVLLGEYRVFAKETGNARATSHMASVDMRQYERHPAVDMWGIDAQTFCTWAGLRLPTDREWLWAATGVDEYGSRLAFPWSVRSQHNAPWGDDLCVAGDVVTRAATRQLCERCRGPVELRSTGPSSEVFYCPACERCPDWPYLYGPARPLGVSWCGAADMCGNVWEMTADGSQYGGSFRTTWWPKEGVGRRSNEHVTSGDEVGFRVALSAL